MRRAYLFGGTMGCALLALWSCSLDDSAVVQIDDTGDASTTDSSTPFDAANDTTDIGLNDGGSDDTGVIDSGPCVGTFPTCDTNACASTEICTPPIPTGWHVTNFIPSAQACDVAYGGDAGGSSVVEITDGGAAACNCTCTGAGSPTCANAHVAIALGSGATCNVGGSSFDLTGGCAALGSFTVGANSEATVSISSGATCTGAIAPTIPTIDGGLSTTCDLKPDAGAICADHRECVPKPSSGHICIAQAAPTDGGALACPSGFSYSLQATVASSFTDTRSCSACQCGFNGIGCTAPVAAFDTAADCTGTDTTITQGTCASNGLGGLAVHLTGTDAPPSCLQTDGGAVSGSATVVTPETICCAN